MSTLILVLCLAEGCVIVWLLRLAKRANSLSLLALERQLRMYRDKKVWKRRATRREKLLFVLLSRLIPEWKEHCFAFTPRTVMRWKKQWVRIIMRKRENRGGRARISDELREVIRTMAIENPTWRPGRIRKEIVKLGLSVSLRTVRYYVDRIRGPHPRGDQTWANFIRNHADLTLAMDFAVDYSPTLTGKLKRVWILAIIEVGSRRVVRLQATEHPNREWLTNQLRDAIPSDHPYRYIIHDNDQLFGCIEKTFESFGVESLRTPFRSPQANAYAERFIGTLRRELLDWVWPLGLRHLNRMLDRYAIYFNRSRPHMGLCGAVPEPAREPPTLALASDALPEDAEIVSIPHLGGLHHEYRLEPRQRAA